MDGFLSVSGGSVSADNNGVQQLVKAAAADYSKYAPKALLDDNNTNKLFKPKIDPKEAFFQNIARLKFMEAEIKQIGSEIFGFDSQFLEQTFQEIALGVHTYVQDVKIARNLHTAEQRQLSPV